MSDKDIVTTVYGKHHKHEVYKKPGGVFSSATYYIERDDGQRKGPYRSMAEAVEAAHKWAGPDAYES